MTLPVAVLGSPGAGAAPAPIVGPPPQAAADAAERGARLRRLAAMMQDVPLAYRDRALAPLLMEIAGGGAGFTLGQLGGVRRWDAPGGVAVIDIEGFLAHRGGGGSALGAYEAIRAHVAAAAADPAIKGIALMIDSPGGEISGMFEAAEAIYRARQAKPIWAIAAYSACSAAYLLAAAASRVVVARLGEVGSIGVLCLRFDTSRATRAQGIRIRPIFFGRRKADGLEFLPMGAAERARTQRHVDTIGHEFVAAVARYRALPPGRVTAQQAACYRGKAAIGAGLADAECAGLPDQTLAEFAQFLAGSAEQPDRARALPVRVPAARRAVPAQARTPAPAREAVFEFQGIGRGLRRFWR